jgi:hypothetical protein
MIDNAILVLALFFGPVAFLWAVWGLDRLRARAWHAWASRQGWRVEP